MLADRNFHTHIGEGNRQHVGADGKNHPLAFQIIRLSFVSGIYLYGNRNRDLHYFFFHYGDLNVQGIGPVGYFLLRTTQRYNRITFCRPQFRESVFQQKCPCTATGQEFQLCLATFAVTVMVILDNGQGIRLPGDIQFTDFRHQPVPVLTEGLGKDQTGINTQFLDEEATHHIGTFSGQAGIEILRSFRRCAGLNKDTVDICTFAQSIAQLFLKYGHPFTVSCKRKIYRIAFSLREIDAHFQGVLGIRIPCSGKE